MTRGTQPPFPGQSPPKSCTLLPACTVVQDYETYTTTCCEDSTVTLLTALQRMRGAAMFPDSIPLPRPWFTNVEDASEFSKGRVHTRSLGPPSDLQIQLGLVCPENLQFWQFPGDADAAGVGAAL